MRFDFKMPAPTNEKLRKSLEFTNRVLQNDRLMHEYILVPCFDRKQYNSVLKEDLAEGATCIAGHHHIRHPGTQCHTRATRAPSGHSGLASGGNIEGEMTRYGNVLVKNGVE